MSLKSIAGIGCYVKNLAKTTKFYEDLGFKFKEQTGDHATAYLNWFWLSFYPIDKETKPKFKEEANLPNKGAGLYINVNVDNIDEFYQSLLAKGLKPSSEPRDWPWGNREFVIRDPDSYKLVFFQKL